MCPDRDYTRAKAHAMQVQAGPDVLARFCNWVGGCADVGCV